MVFLHRFSRSLLKNSINLYFNRNRGGSQAIPKSGGRPHNFFPEQPRAAVPPFLKNFVVPLA
jgi:hypothetical protein